MKEDTAQAIMGVVFAGIVVLAILTPIVFAIAKFGLIVAAIAWLMNTGGCS